MPTRSDTRRFLKSVCSVISPVLLYLGGCALVRAVLRKVSGSPELTDAFVPLILMLPVLFAYCGRDLKKCLYPVLFIAFVFLLFLFAVRKETAVEILAYGLAGPLNEEIIYRGYALQRGKSAMGTGFSVCLSALLFSVGHSSLPQMLVAFAAGVLLACLMEKTKRIEAPFALHSLFNILQIFAAYR